MRWRGFFGDFMGFAQIYNDLLNKVRDAAEDAVVNDVAPEVKDIMEEQTEYQVYSYEASAMAMRTRRVDNGGLGDRRNMVDTVETDTAGLHSEITLTVEDRAPFQDGRTYGVSLAQVVETGDKSFKQPYPRPFIAGTQAEAIASGRAYRALMDGLRRNGF